MTTWQEFVTEAPDLAARVEARFTAHRHLTMATIRADGAPRICGTEAPIVAGELWLGGMIGSRRFADLRRDPRIAVHSGSDDPESWTGDAKVAGIAVEITDPAVHDTFRGSAGEVPPGPFELFRIDLTEAVVVRLDDARESLLIDVWHPGQPVRTVTRR